MADHQRKRASTPDAAPLACLDPSSAPDVVQPYGNAAAQEVLACLPQEVQEGDTYCGLLGDCDLSSQAYDDHAEIFNPHLDDPSLLRPGDLVYSCTPHTEESAPAPAPVDPALIGPDYEPVPLPVPSPTPTPAPAPAYEPAPDRGFLPGYGDPRGGAYDVDVFSGGSVTPGMVWSQGHISVPRGAGPIPGGGGGGGLSYIVP